MRHLGLVLVIFYALCLLLWGIILKDAHSAYDFELGSTEYLEQADGLSTDISGADQSISVCLWVKFESIPSGNQGMVTKVASTTTRQWYFY